MSSLTSPRLAPWLRLTSVALCLSAVGAACDRSSKNETPGSGGSAGRQAGSGGVEGPRDAASDATNTRADAAGGATNQPQGKRCIVHLHGKSSDGGPTSVSGNIMHLRPRGNADGWNGRQWLYFPDSGYNEVRSIVASAISGAACGAVIVHGFSNGGAAAAKLYCRGETFGGTVVGYIADDPVPDHAVENCGPAAGVKMRVYWTGNLAYATNGWDCVGADWTCEGNTTVGIDRYVELLGTTATRSIHTEHREYASPPEYNDWW